VRQVDRKRKVAGAQEGGVARTDGLVHLEPESAKLLCRVETVESGLDCGGRDRGELVEERHVRKVQRQEVGDVRRASVSE